MDAEENKRNEVEYEGFEGQILEGMKVDDLKKLDEAFRLFKACEKDISRESKADMRGRAADLMREAFSR